MLVVPSSLLLRVVHPRLLQKMALDMALSNKPYANWSLHRKIASRPPFGACQSGMSCRVHGYVPLLHASLERSSHELWHPFLLSSRVRDTRYHQGFLPLRQHPLQPSHPFCLNKTYNLLTLALRRLYIQTRLLINNRWLLLQGTPL